MTQPSRLQLGDLLIDLERQRVHRGADELPVAGLSFRLLAHVLLAGTRVVSFDELIEAVWAPAVVNEETVTQRVKLLRQALGDDSRKPRYLRSVRGVGYQLCTVPVEVIDVPSKDAPTRSPVSPRIGAVAFAAGASILAVVTIVWLLAAAPEPASHPQPADTVDELLARAEHYAGIGQRDNNERAIALLEQAHELRPQHVPTLVRLSRGYSARVCLYNQPDTWAHQALDLAQRAIALAPHEASAHAAAGYAQDCLGRWSDALAGYEQSLALDGDNDAVRASAAYLYERSGRLADALRANLSVRDPDQVRFLPIQLASNLELLDLPVAAEARYERSFRLYPDSVFSNAAWPRFLFTRGRFQEAQAALDEAFDRDTEHPDLHLLDGEMALLRGEREQALAAFQHAAALRPHTRWPETLVALYATDSAPGSEQLAECARQLSKGLEPGQSPASDWLELALLEMASGHREAAMQALFDAIEQGYRGKDQLLVSPLFQSLRSEPGFAVAIDDIGRRVRSEREQVLNDDWLPSDLRALLSASP